MSVKISYNLFFLANSGLHEMHLLHETLAMFGKVVCCMLSNTNNIGPLNVVFLF